MSNYPKFPTITLTRERKMRLATLLEEGLTVPAKSGGSMRINFVAVGNPFPARSGTGWQAVKIAEKKTGVHSTLLLENDEPGGIVSGMVRLRWQRQGPAPGGAGGKVILFRRPASSLTQAAGGAMDDTHTPHTLPPLLPLSAEIPEGVELN